MMVFQIPGWNVDPVPEANSSVRAQHPSKTHIDIDEGKNTSIFRRVGHDRGEKPEFTSLPVRHAAAASI
jgi:hypothetical protein